MKTAELIRDEIRRYENLKKSHTANNNHRDALTCEIKINVLMDLLVKMASGEN